jgi:hypothetical protein
MEIWKDIPGFESLYQASNLGRIRSAPGKTTSSAKFEKRVWQVRILKPKNQRRKATDRVDSRVELWKNGKHKTYLVARLVALAWCPGYFDGATVNHIDGNPQNNNANNLEWVSLKENISKGFDAGLYPCKKVTLYIDGMPMKFRSCSEASKAINRSKSYVSTAIYNNRKIVGNGVNVTGYTFCD